MYSEANICQIIFLLATITASSNVDSIVIQILSCKIEDTEEKVKDILNDISETEEHMDNKNIKINKDAIEIKKTIEEVMFNEYKDPADSIDDFFDTWD